MLVWRAFVPLLGVGLLVTQFHALFDVAPAGSASSSHSVLTVAVPVRVEEVVAVVAGVVAGMPLPTVSSVTRPLESVRPMPPTVAPSRPTRLAGISKRTHWPAAGNAPMWRRLEVLLLP